MQNEWQTECDRLGKIADAAWKRYGDAITAGEVYPTPLFESAKKASDDYDRNGEQEPTEPVLTLTQTQVVALWKATAAQLNVYVEKAYRKGYYSEMARAWSEMLGLPSSWVDILVAAVGGGD